MLTCTFVSRDYSPDRAWRLVAWCAAHGADEFSLTICADRADSCRGSRFFRALRPLQVRARLRTTLEGGVGSEVVRKVPLWRLNETSIGFLRATLPMSPMAQRYFSDLWLEDFAVYRGGELMLGVVSREGRGLVELTAGEVKAIEAEGFPVFRAPDTRTPGFVAGSGQSRVA